MFSGGLSSGARQSSGVSRRTFVRRSPRGVPLMTTLRRQPSILVADDDATVRSNLALLLRSDGYEVQEAADGVQAAKAFDSGAAALALLDLKMPGKSGMDILRDHQDQLEDTPVIVITALGGSAAAI